MSIAEPISDIYNACISTGIFPDKLKIAKIIPLFKKDSKKTMGNYRPISLLPSISKIFEKIMFRNISQYLEKHEILSNNQNGFRKGRSTSSTIHNCIQKITDALDKKDHLLGVFCDLSKAFDCVDHTILLMKLDHYGIRGTSLQFMESYISKRTQVTQISSMKNNVESVYISSTKEISCGVPQGSILGPLLFSIYINDLPFLIENTELFADDTSLIIRESSLSKLSIKADSSIVMLNEWFRSNKLLLNSGKSNFIQFHSLQNSKTVDRIDHIENVIDGTRLLPVKHMKFLGLLLDENLNWSEHCASLLSKLNSACFAIRTIKCLTNIQTAKLIYYSNFESHLRYGIEFWGHSPGARKIFSIQKRAIRFLCGLKSHDFIQPHCQEHFRKQKILTLFSLYILESLTLIKKNLNSHIHNHNVHSHFTRHNNNLHVQQHRMKLTQYNSMHINIKFYNKLPPKIKKINNMKAFRQEVKVFLIDKAYYSINDFLEDCSWNEQ